MTEIVALDGLVKRFGNVQAVADLSLTVPSGCIYGFLGPNGAGKTTTLRMIMNFFRPDQGQIHMFGKPLGPHCKERLGYLPEEKGIYKNMTAEKLIAYLGTLKGLPSGVSLDRARALLDRYGLAQKARAKCGGLSKGMQQKVQLLGCLIHEPELLILDEPFSGLDPINTELLRDLILQLKHQGRTIIFSTHQMDQAERLCDFILLINKGRKVLDGSLAQIRKSSGSSIRLDYAGDGRCLKGTPGLTRLNDEGQSAELILDQQRDPQTVLRWLVERLTIRKFDIREVSLHEIFVSAVGRDGHE